MLRKCENVRTILFNEQSLHNRGFRATGAIFNYLQQKQLNNINTNEHIA